MLEISSEWCRWLCRGAKDETIGVLKERLQALEEDNRALRAQFQRLINKVLEA